MVLALIKEANPSLPIPIEVNSVTFGPPRAIIPKSGKNQNTEVMMFARGNTGYISKSLVRYRRIDLATLFRGLSAEIYKYTASGTTEYPFDVYTLLKEINRRFGLNLTKDDVINNWFPWQNDRYYPDKRSSQTVMKATPTSLMYVGETTLRWVSDAKSLADMILVLEVPGRSFPGGNDFSEGSKYRLDIETYDADFNEFADMGHAFMTLPLGAQDPSIVIEQNRLLNGINVVSGKTYTFDPVGEPFALGGITPQRYTLPHPNFPEANSANYNRLLVINYPESGAWGVGKLFLHYNAG